LEAHGHILHHQYGFGQTANMANSEGQTILILKKSYGMLTASMTEILYKHAKEVGAIPYEQ